MSHLSVQPPASLPLDQPLPADVIAGMTWGPFRYRKYPVFSRRWFLGRLVSSLGLVLLHAILVSLYAVLAVMGNVVNVASLPNAFAALGFFVGGVLLMCTLGPALATFVRHGPSPRRHETGSVVTAVILGFLASGVAVPMLVETRHLTEANRTSINPDNAKPDPVTLPHKKSDLEEDLLGLARAAGGLLYFACGGGLAALAYFSERRRIHARQAHLGRLESDMRLTVLQAQVEPHFLFNTLASIRPLIRQDAAQAEAALDALSDHLRAVIPQMRAGSGATGGALASTLGQQFDICASYLALMRLRMGARLHHEIHVPVELRPLEFPPLMLLTLVENAVKHGIEPKPGPGEIIIRAQAAGADLIVSVTDNGAGLKEGLGAGLGLSNIREQLNVRYPHAARLQVAARPDGGTVAEIHLPLKTLGS